ncbi:MAG: hypothetical protein A3G11_00340 [Candidatus Lloydbacteria bacterium RIFCSPLOWO2_12_FULL_51_9]|uniref:Uncharacterized protein n=1 Tax=Candidatus Lloydbacteria bacterium RIFCSPLOWO2_12_FULL_51_9 TaxID=1798669 RepID=A0A1G2DTC2_9BACT|nr:MAG: hypothetical protein A3G11_00340 [Candidatus Lloydbacteria bacterium RIFCSPLOWO2_12_FULL_51_9]
MPETMPEMVPLPSVEMETVNDASAFGAPKVNEKPAATRKAAKKYTICFSIVAFIRINICVLCAPIVIMLVNTSVGCAFLPAGS